MKNNKTLNLVEALRGTQEKISTLFGLLSLGSLALSIYIFGTHAIFSWVTFLAYMLFSFQFLYSSNKLTQKNAWFTRLFMFLNGIEIILSLAGWIWVLYLAQENPGGRFDPLVNLPFYYFLLFFLLTFLISFACLMISLVGLSRRKKIDQ